MQSGPCAMADRGELCSGHVPARWLAGGEGLGEGKVEELKPHLWVPGIGVGVVCNGGATASSGPAAN